MQECARGVLLTPSGQILLLETVSGSGALWITPGGRIRDPLAEPRRGYRLEAAATRPKRHRRMRPRSVRADDAIPAILGFGELTRCAQHEGTEREKSQHGGARHSDRSATGRPTVSARRRAGSRSLNAESA